METIGKSPVQGLGRLKGCCKGYYRATMKVSGFRLWFKGLGF